jgi:hypothetical protein
MVAVCGWGLWVWGIGIEAVSEVMMREWDRRERGGVREEGIALWSAAVEMGMMKYDDEASEESKTILCRTWD